MEDAYRSSIKKVLNEFGLAVVSETGFNEEDKTITYATQVENSMGTIRRKMSVTVNEEVESIRIIIFLETNIPEYKHPAVYQMINEMQQGWRYVRMYLTCNNDLVSDYEVIIRKSAGAENQKIFSNNIRDVFRTVASISMRFAEQTQKVLCQDRNTTKDGLTPDQIDLCPF